MYLISFGGMLLCTHAKLIKPRTCAAARESIVNRRVKNENMQHRDFRPQPQDVMEVPHGGVDNNAGPP